MQTRRSTLIALIEFNCKQAARCMSKRLGKTVHQARQWHKDELGCNNMQKPREATLSRQCKSLQMPFLKVLQQTGES